MKSAAGTLKVLEALSRQYPGADTELAYRNPFELLVATILSAQSTDAGVNLVTVALFSRFPDAAALANAPQTELEALIKSTGFFRQKARAITGMARALVDQHQGQVPAAMEALIALPGVGRKTANVVLGHALGIPGFPVDRHVLRVANRLGVVTSDDPETVEARLTSVLPPPSWTRLSDTVILHGRRVCKPKPLCPRCAVSNQCDFFRSGHTLHAPPPARHPTARARAGAAARRARERS